MRIIRRHKYKKEKDVLVADIYEEELAELICRLLNQTLNLNDTDHYFYQAVTDQFKI